MPIPPTNLHGNATMKVERRGPQRRGGERGRHAPDRPDRASVYIPPLLVAAVLLLPVPSAAQPVASADDCYAVVGDGFKRAHCLACVRQGGAFHRDVGQLGLCRKRGAAPLRPTRVIETAVDCRQQITQRGERARCFACVREGGVFHAPRRRPGFCRRRATVPSPPVTPGAIRTVPACRGRIAARAKQRRCVACVSGGGTFYRQGRGSGLCRRAEPTPRRPPPSRVTPGMIRSARDCRDRIATLRKRRRCVACLKRGGVFDSGARRGAGDCRR
jgi:hypothetical protein